MEWIDIVDESNCVIGCGTRDYVHKQGLRHRSSHLLLFNPQGDLLLQQRAHTKNLFPGLWDSSAAGHLEVGENEQSAALRECQEELSIKPEGIEFLFALPARQENDWEFIHVFTGITQQTIEAYDQEEVHAVRWMSLEAIEAAISRDRASFTPTFLQIYALL